MNKFDFEAGLEQDRAQAKGSNVFGGKPPGFIQPPPAPPDAAALAAKSKRDLLWEQKRR